ncbi:hypothetical protein TDIS_1043 [Thermosulfurimonas dismutans]|uniref:Uncharacterized protein n=1 Tax=Thermosulfurimonas dismutans TaxID=999894 RepID=A0A179D4F5_9BACT|nr:hypothetical protein TDIS_1043 [Thermosulfurimonas dismutans]
MPSSIEFPLSSGIDDRKEDEEFRPSSPAHRVSDADAETPPSETAPFPQELSPAEFSPQDRLFP